MLSVISRRVDASNGDGEGFCNTDVVACDDGDDEDDEDDDATNADCAPAGKILTSFDAIVLAAAATEVGSLLAVCLRTIDSNNS